MTSLRVLTRTGAYQSVPTTPRPKGQGWPARSDRRRGAAIKRRTERRGKRANAAQLRPGLSRSRSLGSHGRRTGGGQETGKGGRPAMRCSARAEGREAEAEAGGGEGEGGRGPPLRCAASTAPLRSTTPPPQPTAPASLTLLVVLRLLSDAKPPNPHRHFRTQLPSPQQRLTTTSPLLHPPSTTQLC